MGQVMAGMSRIWVAGSRAVCVLSADGQREREKQNSDQSSTHTPPPLGGRRGFGRARRFQGQMTKWCAWGLCMAAFMRLLGITLFAQPHNQLPTRLVLVNNQPFARIREVVS